MMVANKIGESHWIYIYIYKCVCVCVYLDIDMGVHGILNKLYTTWHIYGTAPKRRTKCKQIVDPAALIITDFGISSY